MRPPRKEIKTSSLVLIGISKEFIEKDIKDFETFGDKDLLNVKTYIEGYIRNLVYNFENNISLFIQGANGCGKSFISCMILKEAYRLRYSAKRLTFTQYIDYYTESWKPVDVSVDLTEYLYADFLNLEEVGKEIDSKIATPILESLLRLRVERSLPTLICTNLSLADFSSKYGASVMSLIKGNYYPITIDSKDRRQEMFERKKK